MSQRSKKRRGRQAQKPRPRPTMDQAQGQAEPPAPSMRARLDEAPPAPWAPLPLTELMIFFGLIFMIAGWIVASGPRQVAMVVGGIALISLASAELALREHLAGYRSHSMVLAAIPAAVVAALCWILWHEFALVPRATAPVALLATFGFAVWQLRELFKRRSGGISFRV